MPCQMYLPIPSVQSDWVGHCKVQSRVWWTFGCLGANPACCLRNFEKSRTDLSMRAPWRLGQYWLHWYHWLHFPEQLLTSSNVSCLQQVAYYVCLVQKLLHFSCRFLRCFLQLKEGADDVGLPWQPQCLSIMASTAKLWYMKSRLWTFGLWNVAKWCQIFTPKDHS